MFKELTSVYNTGTECLYNCGSLPCRRFIPTDVITVPLLMAPSNIGPVPFAPKLIAIIWRTINLYFEL